MRCFNLTGIFISHHVAISLAYQLATRSSPVIVILRNAGLLREDLKQFELATQEGRHAAAIMYSLRRPWLICVHVFLFAGCGRGAGRSIISVVGSQE
jgi:hypothetical protein